MYERDKKRDGGMRIVGPFYKQKGKRATLQISSQLSAKFSKKTPPFPDSAIKPLCGPERSC